MAMRRFKRGDVVQLKSGGPQLTVDSTDGQKVGAIGFLGSDERFEHVHLDADLLVRVRPAEDPA